ncbi:MAG: MEKHLA domain-containing protein [Pseudomonadota bacterium]
MTGRAPTARLPARAAASETVPAVDPARVELIIASHRRLTGRPLALGDMPDPVRALWCSPLAVVAHGTEDDPVFFYGNRLALRRFEMAFDAFVAMPSRLSAEPMLREERERLLEQVRDEGWIGDYSGVRIAASGRRFRIDGAIVWNLVDEQGRHRGQAAAFAAEPPAGATGCG